LNVNKGTLNPSLPGAPPSRYPDLFVLLLCAYCCAQFLLAWGYATWKVWLIAGTGRIETQGNETMYDVSDVYVSDIPPFNKKNQ